jgi:hypothetical protein
MTDEQKAAFGQKGARLKPWNCRIFPCLTHPDWVPCIVGP